MKKTAFVLISVLSLLLSSLSFAGGPGYGDDGYGDLSKVDPQLAQEFAKQDEASNQRGKDLIEYELSLDRLIQLSAYISYHRSWLGNTEELQVWFPVAVGLLAGYYGYIRPSNQPSGFGKTIDEFLEVKPLTKGQKFTSATMAAAVFFALAEFAVQHRQSVELKNIQALSDEDVLVQYKQQLCETNRQGKALGFPELEDTTGAAPKCP